MSPLIHLILTLALWHALENGRWMDLQCSRLELKFEPLLSSFCHRLACPRQRLLLSPESRIRTYVGQRQRTQGASNMQCGQETSSFLSIFWPHCVACGILLPNLKWNPCPWNWKLGALTTGQPGKSLNLLIFC